MAWTAEVTAASERLAQRIETAHEIMAELRAARYPDEQLERRNVATARAMASARDNADPGEDDLDDDTAAMLFGIEQAQTYLAKAAQFLTEDRYISDRVQEAVDDAVLELAGGV